VSLNFHKFLNQNLIFPGMAMIGAGGHSLSIDRGDSISATGEAHF
jgi:hypothetical protein